MTSLMKKTQTVVEEVDSELSEAEESAQSSDSQEEKESSQNEDDFEKQDSEEERNSGEEKQSSSDNDDDVNSGWADSMAKILKTNKPKGKKSLVLSKAKKITDIKKTKKEDPGFEIIGDMKEEKPSIKQLSGLLDEDEEPKVKKRREDLPNFRVKPNILEKEREKILSKIATRGVVQLFNAVRNQQKDIETKKVKAGPLERKKDKVMKSLDKNKFLDILMGQSKSEDVNKELMKKETKKEEEEGSKWSVFRDDFMMGAKMKDWDKTEKQKSDEENLSSMSETD